MKPKPNILLITCDQLQAFATGCYGNPDVKTPHPDRLSPRVDTRNLAGLIDVAPTLLTAVGLHVPAHMPGTDVLNSKVEASICEITPGKLAVRTGRFTAHADLCNGTRRQAFFDNQQDPFQMRNLVEEDVFADEKERLFALLADHHATVRIMPKPDYGLLQT